MINLTYTEYLTEIKLIDLIHQLSCIKSFTYTPNIKIGNKFRGDVSIETLYNKYLIEFDGYQHFTDPNCICRDKEKDFIVFVIDIFEQYGDDLGIQSKEQHKKLVEELEKIKNKHFKTKTHE